MQAIGTEVIIALTPLFLLLSLTIYFLFPKIKLLYQNMRREGPARNYDPVQQHPRFGEGECSICFQRKKYQVSVTCGHSFCGNCLFEIYQRFNDRIMCPLCRKQITTIFRVFGEREGTAEGRRTIADKIHNYNQRFDDNRPFLRKLAEFPTILKRLRPIIFSPLFLVLFIRSIFFLRFVFFFVFYLLLPFDIIPESVFGTIGFLDDIFISFIILMFMMAAFGILFIRRRRP